jgi:hypothetical protein
MIPVVVPLPTVKLFADGTDKTVRSLVGLNNARPLEVILQAPPAVPFIVPKGKETCGVDILVPVVIVGTDKLVVLTDELKTV